MKVVYQEYPQLYATSSLESFLSLPPRSPLSIFQAQQQLKNRGYSKKELVQALLTYNKEIGNDGHALQNIHALESHDAFCVITGQQVGLMGGPIYTILKAMSCLIFARQHQAIPIFWAATEDHDIAEINHAYFVDDKGNLKRHQLHLPTQGFFAEDLVLRHEDKVALEGFFNNAGFSIHLAENITFTQAMMRCVVQLFAGTGLVFVEPYILRHLAVPFVRKELLEWKQTHQILQNTTEKIEKAGGSPVLKFNERPNIFFKSSEKLRRKIDVTSEGYLIGGQTYPQNLLLNILEQEPQRFSLNVASRTVFQNQLFPVLAYIAGPTEMNYYLQLKDYHNYHNVPMPWIYPRLSATFVPQKAFNLLERCHLNPWDTIPHRWDAIFPHIADDSLDPYRNKQSLKELLKNHGLSYDALHYLQNLLKPKGKLQERVLNWFGFQSLTKENLIQECLKTLDMQKPGHYYCILNGI